MGRSNARIKRCRASAIIYPVAGALIPTVGVLHFPSRNSAAGSGNTCNSLLLELCVHVLSRTCTQSSRRTCTTGRARSARRTCTKGRARSARRRTCTQRSRRTCTREGREVLLAFSTCCQGEVLLAFSTCCQGEGCLADTPCEDSGLSRRQSAEHARRVLFKVCLFVWTRGFNFPAVHARRVLFCSFVRARAVLIFR